MQSSHIARLAKEEGVPENCVRASPNLTGHISMTEYQGGQMLNCGQWYLRQEPGLDMKLPTRRGGEMTMFGAWLS